MLVTALSEAFSFFEAQLPKKISSFKYALLVRLEN
jgi:hypothetical protein